MKKTTRKLLCLALVLVMVIGIVPFASATTAPRNLVDFSDEATVPEEHREAVDLLTALGVITGLANTDGTYRLANERPITRAEAAAIVTRILIGPDAAANLPTVAVFSDVPVTGNNSWANAYVGYLYYQGIVAGVGGGRFAPDSQVTGFQMARMLLSAIGYGVNDEFIGSGWEMRVNQLARARGIDILSGVGEINFAAPATRIQVMQYTFNALTIPNVVVWNSSLNQYVDRFFGAGMGWAGDGRHLGYVTFGLFSDVGNDGIAYRVRQWRRVGVAAPLTAQYRNDVTVSRATDGTGIIPTTAGMRYFVNGREYIFTETRLTDGVTPNFGVAISQRIDISGVLSSRTDLPNARSVTAYLLVDGRVGFGPDQVVLTPGPGVAVGNASGQENMMDVLRLFAARRGFIVEQTALLEGAPADRLIIVAPQGARIDGAVTRNAAANTVTVPGLRNTVPGSVPNPFDAASTLAVGTFGAANINFLDGADPAIGDHVLYFTDALGVTHVRVAESVAGSISYMSGPVANRLVRFGASADTQAEYFGSQMGIEPSIPNPWRFIPFTAQGASIGVQTTAWLDAGGHIFAFDSVRIDPPGYIAVTRVTDIAGAAVITGILSDGRTVVSLQVAGLTAAVIQNQINAGNPIFSYSNLVLLDGGARGTVTLAQIGQANRSRVVPLHTTLGQDGQRFDNRPIGTATILPANDPTQQEFFRTPNFMRIPPVGVVGTAANQVPFADSFTSFVVNGATGIAGLPRDTSTNIGIVTRTQGYANAPFFNNYTTGMRAWAVVYNPPHAGGEETVFVYVDGGNARGAVVAAQRRMFIGLDLQSATLNAGVGPVFEANGNVSVTVVDLDAENNTSRVTLTAAAWAQLQGLIAPNTVVPAKLLNVTVGAGGLIVAVSLPTDTAFGFGFAGITPGNTLTLNPGWWTGNPATPPQAQTFGVSGQVPFIYIALNGTVTVQMGQATPTAMYMWYGVTTGVAPQQNITRFYQVERVNIPVPSLAPATAVLTLPEATALAPANTAVWNALTATPAPAGTVEVPFRFVNQAGATLTAATPATTVVLTADTLGAVTFAWPATAMNPALTVPPATPGTWVVPVSYYGVNLGTVTVTVTPTALPLVIVNPDAVMVGSSADPMTSLSEVQDRLAGLFLLYDGSAVNVPAGTPVNYTNMTWADIITMAPLAMNATRTAGVGTVITSNGAPAVAQAILDVLAELDAGAFGSTSTFVITLDPTDGNPATVTFVLYNQNGLALVDNTAAADAEFAAVQAQLAAIPGVAALVNYNVINTALTELATVFANVDPTNAATVPNPVAVNNLLIAIEALVTGPTDFTALTPAQLALADAVTALVPGSGFTQAQLQAFATAADATSPANAAALMTAFANLAGALPASL